MYQRLKLPQTGVCICIISCMKDLGIKKDLNKKIQYLWYKYC